MKALGSTPGLDHFSTMTSQLSTLTAVRFIPYLRPMVWGGRRLGEVLGKTLPSDECYGESWEVSDHPQHRSVIATGADAGQTLRCLMQEHPEQLLGSAARRHVTFPWLVKFLDACDWLSVQVHPDEEAVKRLWPGEGSKTEAWFVLDAAPGSRIYAGLLPGVHEKELRASLAAGKAADCLHHFQPKTGDCLYLPAGTVHAVGGGVLMAEVQQTSDATFRLFDWNRRDAQGKARTLHIDQALACIDWKRGPVQPIRSNYSWRPTHAVSERQSLVQCPYFHLEFRRQADAFTCGGEGKLQLLIALGGSGRLLMTPKEEPVKIGQAWLLPAEMSRVECHPVGELAFLFCTLPSS
ncbi:MAG TPA: type I phosphomannose isomerase catalytic subunit [Gemmataceae bacterium]|nr:type I phosphomannose isomerase catalytic subunit [Gemmataceae bacterium]